MLGTELLVSMYTRKTSIDKWHLNVTQLCSIFCKIQISIELFYLYQRLQCTDNYFFQIKFVLFLYLLLSALSKENDVTWYFSVIKKTVGYWTTVFTHRFSGVSILQYGCFESCQFDHVPFFSCLDVWISRQTISGVYAIIVTTSAYHSRRCGRL